MSLPVWPANIQHRPMWPSFRLAEPHVPHHETEFEGGADRRRPRSTVRRQLYSIVWHWEDAEFGRFEAFYHRTLGEGAMQFTMPFFLVGGYVTSTCKFKGSYEVTRPNRFRQVSAQLYVYGGA